MAMSKTNRFTTPGGMPDFLPNPPSSEAGSKDSGESQLLLLKNPFAKATKTVRSPPSGSKSAGNQSPPVVSKDAKSDSEKIKLLESNNIELRLKLDEISQICQELKQEVESLRKENKTLKDSLSGKQKQSEGVVKQPKTQCEYETDEEELARETEKKRPSKKRKVRSSPEVLHQIKVTDSTPNNKPVTKTILPPPINIVGQADYKKLLPILKETVQTNFKVKLVRNKTWKIDVTDSDSYRNLSKRLNTEKIEWFTYSSKQDRPLRVVARGLHPSCSKEDIMSDLQVKGFNILDATNIIRKEKQNHEGNQNAYVRHALPLFMLSFDKDENIEKIYNIKTIMNIIVKIEPLRRNNRLIPQCKRCQGFNHTQAYCRKDPICVKCAGKHSTIDCHLKKESPATCANCNGKHPANYRGCEVAKEILRRRTQLIKQPTQNSKGKQNKKDSKSSAVILPGPSSALKTAPKPLKKAEQEASKQREQSNRIEDKDRISGKEEYIRPNTYAQVVMHKQSPEISTPDATQKVLSLILEKLEEQSKINSFLLEKINKLKPTRRVVPKKQKKL